MVHITLPILSAILVLFTAGISAHAQGIHQGGSFERPLVRWRGENPPTWRGTRRQFHPAPRYHGPIVHRPRRVVRTRGWPTQVGRPFYGQQTSYGGYQGVRRGFVARSSSSRASYGERRVSSGQGNASGPVSWKPTVDCAAMGGTRTVNPNTGRPSCLVR